MIIDSTINEFLDVLASKEPVPGGGGASALCGAIGIALGSMVANLTVGKKKYAAVQEQIAGILIKTEQLRRDLTALADEDAKAFYPLSQAYGLPRGTDEQTEFRDSVMERVLTDASLVPLKIMEKVIEAIDLLETLGSIGSKIAVSDVGVGVQLCRSALLGAVMNVFINTKMMKNRVRAEEFNTRANALTAAGTCKADAVYADVLRQII